MIARRLLVLMFVLLSEEVASAQPLKPGFFPVHHSEPLLLHRQVNPSALRAFQIWDTHLATWRAVEPREVPGERAAVIVLHLWADWCKPCREEFPALRGILEETDKLYGARVQFVLLSETSLPEAMRAFLEKEKERIPRGPHYLDTGEALADSLRTELPTALSYPVTLVLDSQRMIRHAIVGSVASRRLELLTAISRLTRSAGSQTPTPAR
jgi:thiol-disulfide isomerase/thioredoxin